MAVKLEQQPALTHDQRIGRLQQLTSDLARAVDLAEEQRRMLRAIARDASDLADALTSPEPSEVHGQSSSSHRKRPKKR